MSASPRLVATVRAILSERCLGRENAVTWDSLLRHVTLHHGFSVMAVRRLQEAAEILREQGDPAVGLSSWGVFWARTVDELDEALEENDKRARKALRKRRLLRRVRARMLGQQTLGRAA